jgi:hypothetical protein
LILMVGMLVDLLFGALDRRVRLRRGLTLAR